MESDEGEEEEPHDCELIVKLKEKIMQAIYQTECEHTVQCSAVRTIDTELFSIDGGGNDLPARTHAEGVASSLLFFSALV